MDHSVIKVKLFVVLLDSHLFLFTVSFTVFNTQSDSQFNLLQRAVETEPAEFWKMIPPTHPMNRGQGVLIRGASEVKLLLWKK